MKRSTLFLLTYLAYVAFTIFISLLPGSGKPPAISHLDKISHFVTYGGMAFLGMSAFVSRPKRIIMLAFSVFLGMILEWGQSYVPNRNLSLGDVIANTLGVGFGFFVFKKGNG